MTHGFLDPFAFPEKSASVSTRLGSLVHTGGWRGLDLGLEFSTLEKEAEESEKGNLHFLRQALLCSPNPA